MRVTHITITSLLIGVWACLQTTDAGPSKVTMDEGNFTVHHSPSQLSLVSTAEVIIIPGSNLDTGTSSITGKYVCGDFTANFATTNITGEVEVTVIGGGKKPSCDVHMGDGSLYTIKPPDSEKHTYGSFDVYFVTLECTSDDGDVTCPHNNKSCVVTSDFLDDAHASFLSPIKYFTTDTITINSFMELTPGCGAPDIFWRITHVNVTDIADINITQPGSSVLVIEPGFLEPGEYVVHLEILFPGMGSQYWAVDTLVIRVIYPELVPNIYGGDILDVPGDTIVTINADRSFDPAGDLSEPLLHRWAFATAVSTSSIDLFTADFPFGTWPETDIPPPSAYNIDHGTDYLLEVDTSQFPSGTVCYVIFSLIRGSRKASALQVLNIKDNSLPLSIECVFNCNLYRENKFNKDRLELDTVFPPEVNDTSGFTFTWSIQNFTSDSLGIKSWVTKGSAITSTGLYQSSIGIEADTWISGSTYKIGVTVIAPGYATSIAEVIGTVNNLPYGGTCNVRTLVGVAARDWFVLTCSGWMGADDRWKTNAAADTNPYLTYIVRQYTKDAFVEEEPILLSRSSMNHLILKLGDPNNAYLTTLTVVVGDVYNNAVKVPIDVTATPAFAYYNVNASDYGAGVVMSYTQVDYVYDDQQLRHMGKIDLVMPLVSSVCSHIHLVKIPVWNPPVPRNLNQDNQILDLNPVGNSDVGDMEQLMTDSERPEPDNATLTLMEVMENMTNVMRDTINVFIVNGSRGSDKHLMSMIINAFTNIAGKYQFANFYTRDNVIYLGELLGIDALNPINNTAADQSAQIEQSSGEIFNMSQAIVNTVVPDELRQGRIITDFLNSKQQIDNTLGVTGNGVDLRNADLSPAERSLMYMQMQKELDLEFQERKGQAKKAADMARKLALEVMDKLKVCKTCSNEKSKTTKQLVKKNKADVIKTDSNRMEAGQFRLDGMVEALGENASVTANTSISAIEFTENVFMYDNDKRSSYVTSNVLHIDVKASDTFVSPRFFTFGQTVVDATPELLTPVVDPDDASEFSPHKFIYQSASDNVCIVVKPEDEAKVVKYVLYFNFRQSPTLLDYDMTFVVTQVMQWKVCLTPAQMQGHKGTVYMAVAVPLAVRTVRYYFTIVTAGCLTWEEEAKIWHTDKCEMTWVPEFNKINCICRNLTELTVANSFFVAPNTIDFSVVFLKFSPLNQAAVMGALGGIFMIYVITLVIVIGLDRKDKIKWGITPLRDNIYGHSFYYVIKVFTGMRRGAGTSSRIAFNLAGEKGLTGPRELFDGVRQTFSTGSVMTFFMATKNDLGPLMSLNIWHDNSGHGDLADWYLNGVTILDIATNETYTFVMEGCLSLHSGLDITLKSAGSSNPPEFENRFFRQTRDQLSDSHMWVSILYRPVTSTFTRVQRASCALVYICLAMVANAMYFNPEPDYITPALIQLGPFRFTGQQLFISLICALITTPVVMFLIFLFKRTKPWPCGDGCCRCCSCCRCACACGRGCSRFCYGLFRNQTQERRCQYEASLNQRTLSRDVPSIEGGLHLHHSFIILAWLLVLAGTVVPAFFIMLYSMEWGKQKSEEWLTSFLLSVFQSMIFVDPLMVLCLSCVFACLCKKVKEPLTIDTDALITNYKKWMGEITTNGGELSDSIHLIKSIKSDYKEHQVFPRNVTKPLYGSDLIRAAKEQRHRQQMAAMAKDILLNLLFMTVVFCICYSNRDDLSYFHHREIESNVLEPRKLPYFHKITTPEDWFKWLDRTVIPYLFPEVDWDGNPLPWQTKQFTSGLYTYRLGPPRLRQLKIVNDTCDVPYLGKLECYGQYEFFGEDERDFCVGWTDLPCPNGVKAASPSLQSWKYTPGRDVWGMPIPGELATYSGGGYMATMFVNRNDSQSIVNELTQKLWLGRGTRATFLEFTLYCAETNIFIYSMFLTEFPHTGGAFTLHAIYPMRLYNHQGASGIVTLVCEVLFAIFIIVMLVKICIRMYQQRCGYFKKFWQGYEFVMLIVSLSAIVMYAFRMIFTGLTIKKFKEDMALFVNFSHIVFWDQMFVMLMAILTFMATIRFLEVFSTSKKVSAIVKIFKDCGGDLFWFGTSFFYTMLGFCGFAFLLFGSRLYSYMNLYMCLRTLALALLGKTYYKNLDAIQPIFSKVFFVLYILTIIFFVMTIFMSILGGSIDSVMHDTRNDKREDLMEHIMARFKAMVSYPGLRKRIYPQPSEQPTKTGHRIRRLRV